MRVQAEARARAYEMAARDAEEILDGCLLTRKQVETIKAAAAVV